MLGAYVQIEGPDGAGKTGIVERLKTETRFGLPVESIREPGARSSEDFGEHIRAIFKKFPGLPGSVKFCLMFAARTSFKLEIEQNFSNHLLVSDRGYPSTFAFQIFGEQQDSMAPAFWSMLGSGTIKIPDAIILLDVDIKVGIERMKGSEGREVGIKEFDEAGLAFKGRVRAGYHLFRNISNGTDGGARYWDNPKFLGLGTLLQNQRIKFAPVILVDTTGVDKNTVYERVVQIISEIIRKKNNASE